jgi:hypothetical protein
MTGETNKREDSNKGERREGNDDMNGLKERKEEIILLIIIDGSCTGSNGRILSGNKKCRCHGDLAHRIHELLMWEQHYWHSV